MWINRRADVDRATDPAPFIGATFPVLLGLEHRQHVLEAPASRAVPFPSVVVSLHAARPHHRVDGAAAAQDPAECHVEMAIVELWRGNDRQRPVKRTAYIVEPDAGVGNVGPGILAPRLNA